MKSSAELGIGSSQQAKIAEILDSHYTVKYNYNIVYQCVKKENNEGK